MWFQKISIPSPRRVIGISRGRGMSKTQKFVNESIKLNWNFQRGGGSNQKTLWGGGMDILWNIIMYSYNKCQRIINMDQKTHEGKNKCT